MFAKPPVTADELAGAGLENNLNIDDPTEEGLLDEGMEDLGDEIDGMDDMDVAPDFDMSMDDLDINDCNDATQERDDNDAEENAGGDDGRESDNEDADAEDIAYESQMNQISERMDSVCFFKPLPMSVEADFIPVPGFRPEKSKKSVSILLPSKTSVMRSSVKKVFLRVTEKKGFDNRYGENATEGQYGEKLNGEEMNYVEKIQENQKPDNQNFTEKTNFRKHPNIVKKPRKPSNHFQEKKLPRQTRPNGFCAKHCSIL